MVHLSKTYYGHRRLNERKIGSLRCSCAEKRIMDDKFGVTVAS